jgi:uncharacterized protein YcbK (DUF882 family)
MPVDRTRKLSKHFVLGDMLVDPTFPDLAAQLEPDARSMKNLERLTSLLDRIVDQFPPGLEILSGYRDRRLNDACRKAGLPASVKSLHLSGCAADVKHRDSNLDPEIIYEWLQSRSTELLLHEAVFYPMKGFIHVAVEDREMPTAKRILMRT